jgi:VIT1/CCC1 family predicted Fe2+/Mn2+ transporter
VSLLHHLSNVLTTKEKKMGNKIAQGKSWSEAEAERQEREQMESLMVSLTIAVSTIVLSIVMFVGGAVFLAVSAVFGHPNWAGLVVSMLGLLGFLGLFVWASWGREKL